MTHVPEMGVEMKETYCGEEGFGGKVGENGNVFGKGKKEQEESRDKKDKTGQENPPRDDEEQNIDKQKIRPEH